MVCLACLIIYHLFIPDCSLTCFSKCRSASQIHLTIAGSEHPKYILLDPAFGIEVANGMSPKARLVVGFIVGATALLIAGVISAYFFLRRRKAGYTEV